MKVPEFVKKFVILSFFFLIFIPPALADIIVPLQVYTLPLIPFIILIESVGLWLFVKKNQFSFLRSFFACLVANVATSFFGLFYPIFDQSKRTPNGFTTEGIMVVVLIAFVLSAVIEFFIWLPFFRKYERKINLLMISFVVNAISYVLVLLAMVNRGLF